jgi:hypothetical protein
MRQRKTEQAVEALLSELERPWDPARDAPNDYQRARKVHELTLAVRAAQADDEVASWSEAA